MRNLPESGPIAAHREGFRRPGRALLPALLAALGLLWGPGGRSEAAPLERSAWLFAPDFAEQAWEVDLGDPFLVEDVPLEDESGDPRSRQPPAYTLRLERFGVFSPDAEIVVHGRSGTRSLTLPRMAHFRGRVQGVVNSLAFLSVTEDLSFRGFVAAEGHLWMIASEVPGTPPTVAPLDPNGPLGDAPAPWTCEAVVPPSPLTPPDPSPLTAPDGAGVAPEPDLGGVASADFYSARLAIETDFEFWNLFGANQPAIAYVADLIAAASTIYVRDIGVSLEVSYL